MPASVNQKPLIGGRRSRGFFAGAGGSGGGLAATATGSGTGTDVATNITIPSGRSGDYALVIIYNNIQTIFNTPSGWTKLSEVSQAAGGGSVLAIFGRRLDGSEGANVTFTNASISRNAGVLVTYSGVNAATPTTLLTAAVFAIANPVVPANETVGANCLLVAGGGRTTQMGGPADPTITGGNGMTLRVNASVASTDRSAYIADAATGAGGSVAVGTFTFAGSTACGQAVAIQLNP